MSPIPLFDERGEDAAPRRIRRASHMKLASTPQVTTRSRHKGIVARTNVTYDRTAQPLSDQQKRVLAVLTTEPLTASTLAPRCGLGTRTVASALRFLTAKDRAVRSGGGWRLP